MRKLSGKFGTINNIHNTVRSLNCNLFYNEQRVCNIILKPRSRNTTNKETRAAQTKQCRKEYFVPWKPTGKMSGFKVNLELQITYLILSER